MNHLPNTKHRTPNTRRSRGVILVAALVCLLVVALVGGLMVRAFLVQHRQNSRREQQLQAQWLAESAALRAADRLAADANYAGETWRIAAEAFGDRWPGRAEIRVSPDANAASRRQITIEAFYPDNPARPDQQILHQLEISIDLSTTGASS